ncbi:hypothetical protein ABTP94_18900, partial [Acinetobacter baumannii]
MNSIIKTDAMVDMDLVNLNLFSRKLATGRNSIAIKNARKNGAKILCPKARRYPNPVKMNSIIKTDAMVDM